MILESELDYQPWSFVAALKPVKQWQCNHDRTLNTNCSQPGKAPPTAFGQNFAAGPREVTVHRSRNGTEFKSRNTWIEVSRARFLKPLEVWKFHFRTAGWKNLNSHELKWAEVFSSILQMFGSIQQSHFVKNLFTVFRTFKEERLNHRCKKNG